MTDTKIVLRPLVGLMSGQSPEEIEHHVVQEIEKHRRLRDEASLLEARVDSAVSQDETQQASRAYISVMIAVHAQQTVVSTLLDILGYIPEMAKKKPH